ncbi:B12-binding domain-containing radical SAM protein [bacterium]|nr:B12-binding domain-containing radical SAM protein [bacterium]
MKNGLLIFPPGGDFTNPHLSLPILAAQLKSNGHNVKCMDLSIDFINKIFSADYIRYAIQTNKSFFEKYSKNFIELDKSKNKYLINKYQGIKNMFASVPEDKLKKIPAEIEQAMNILKSPINKDDLKSYQEAMNLFVFVNKFISILFYPLNQIRDNIEKDSYLNLKDVIFNKEINVFIDYYLEKLKSISTDKCDYIGISIGVRDQFIPGLTIAAMLKSKTNAHINIGGSYITRQIENIVKIKDMFSTFADSFSYGEGEQSIVELAKYIDGKIPIENVPRLVYMKNDEIHISKPSLSVDMNEISMPDFSDYNFDKYICPMYILPIQIARGCKWGKCTFCDISMEKTLSTKSIDRLIDELKFYKNNFGIEFFNVIDESVYPDYLDKLSDRLIKEKLNLNFKIECRFEDGFNYNLFKKMKKAGFIYICWGFESANERICKLINKGVNIKNRLKILKDADKAGIYNHLFCIVNFPSETYSEALETVDFLAKHSDIVLSSVIHPFRLLPASLIAGNPEAFGIKILPKDSCDFSSELKYESNTSMAVYEINNIFRMHKEITDKQLFLKVLNSFSAEFYFLSKYGLKELKKLNKSLKNKITI